MIDLWKTQTKIVLMLLLKINFKKTNCRGKQNITCIWWGNFCSIFQVSQNEYFKVQVWNTLCKWRGFWKTNKRHTWCLLWIYMYTSIYLYTYVYIYVCVCIYMYPTLLNNILYIYTHPLTCAYCIYIKWPHFLRVSVPGRVDWLFLDVCSCYLEGCNFIFHLFFPI